MTSLNKKYVLFIILITFMLAFSNKALAKYENKGFLIATDKYPKPNTILAYIPRN